jgi:ABC-type dipeptide/oligopeptide/nickel transport system permease subunit
VTVGVAIVIGMIIGAIAGFFSGRSDNVLMRLMDVVLAFPSLLLAIAIVTVLGTSLVNAQLAIAIVSIPIFARVTRASVLSVREQEFVAASVALGESRIGILRRRIMPNALTPIIVQGTLGIAAAIIEVAALSFLGIGAQPPLAEWGSMIGIERNSVFAAPHLILFPGAAIVLTCLAFNLLGDGVRDALDPRLNR